MSKLRTLTATVAATGTFLAASLMAAQPASALPSGLTASGGHCHVSQSTVDGNATLTLENRDPSGQRYFTGYDLHYPVGSVETLVIKGYVGLVGYLEVFGRVVVSPGATLRVYQSPGMTSTFYPTALVDVAGTLNLNGPTENSGHIRVFDGGELRLSDLTPMSAPPDDVSNDHASLLNAGLISLDNSQLTVRAGNAVTNTEFGAVEATNDSVVRVAAGGSFANDGVFSLDCTSRLEGTVTGTQPTTDCVTDTTPPVLTPTVTGTTGARGWYVSDVSVQWAVARAVDNAGNTTSLTRSYSVLGAPAAGASGFLNPVSMTSVNVVKSGSTVRLAFEVFADGVEVTDPGAVTLTTTPSTVCQNAQPVPPGSELQTTAVSYHSKRGVFLDTWKTPRLPGTCWDITVTSGSTSFTASYQLR